MRDRAGDGPDPGGHENGEPVLKNIAEATAPALAPIKIAQPRA
jgi:hypothetical protein